MPKGILSIVGFILLLFGFLSLILGMIGLRLHFLSFLDQFGNIFPFLIKLIMIIVGIILMYTDSLQQSEDDKK